MTDTEPGDPDGSGNYCVFADGKSITHWSRKPVTEWSPRPDEFGVCSDHAETERQRGNIVVSDQDRQPKHGQGPRNG